MRVTGWFSKVFVLVALMCLAACSRLEDSHGFVPDEGLLDQIVVGVDTRVTAGRILGPPSAQGVISDTGWFYVKSDFRRTLWRAPEEVNRQVVLVSFAEDDRVENIERFGLERGQVVRLSTRVTTSNTRDISILRQLFSNIGNFNPAALFDDG